VSLWSNINTYSTLLTPQGLGIGDLKTWWQRPTALQNGELCSGGDLREPGGSTRKIPPHRHNNLRSYSSSLLEKPDPDHPWLPGKNTRKY